MRILQTTAVKNAQTIVGLQDETTIAFYQQLGKDLLSAADSGLIWLEPTVVREQVCDISFISYGSVPAIGLELAKILRTLLAAARARGGSKDFGIVSLYRPGDGTKSPHLAGRAVDLVSYAGKRLNSAFPDEAAEGATSVYRDLAAAPQEMKVTYAFGLPRNLRTDNDGIDAELTGHGWQIRSAIFATALGLNKQLTIVNQSSTATLKIYDAIRANYKFTDVFFDHGSPPGKSPTGSVKSDISGFVRKSLQTDWRDILTSGGNGLRYLFPDATDHLHIQTV